MTPTGKRFIGLGHEVCGDLEAALRREWLVTNGLGGYAFGTLAGIATRRYHGLLVAALTPPVGRTVLVGGLLEWAAHEGHRITLHAHEHADGTIDGDGYRHLEAFELDGLLPVWTYRLAGARLQKRIWMSHGSNTTCVRYTVRRATRPVTLELRPLVTARDHHVLSSAESGTPTVEPTIEPLADGRVGASVRWPNGGPTYVVASASGDFEAGAAWLRGFLHREESARGLDDRSDLLAAGAFRATIRPGESWTLVLSTDPDPDLDGETALASALDRQTELLTRARATRSGAAVRTLVLAADQFLVDRGIPGAGPGGEPLAGRSVIAGYPWFNDWGRDTMIALPGLTLATGRHEEAATILRAFSMFVRDGLLPNNFPDAAGEVPAYNTADASLWYVIAIRAHERATGDRTLVDDLLPTVREILDRHAAGTRFGIGMDPTDGLLRAGEPGVALTWMDAKVDDWVVTPRIGKPVEINALWANALRICGDWLRERDDDAAAGYLRLADRAATSFRARFWRRELGYCADVLDGPDGDELHLRPNQLFALSLPHPLLEGEEAVAVLDAIGRSLLTGHGLRSLAPDDPEYRPAFQGDRRFRDAAYHQGAVWSWLLPPYAEAWARVHGDPAAALELLRPLVHHLGDAGLGSVSEIFEPAPPHAPRGCVAQAWSVGELLRVWRALTGE